MAEEYSNYDMLDKMIANNKRAKTWMVFWIIALCLLAGAVLWMAFDIADKKKIIIDKDRSLAERESLIALLREDCKGEKEEIVLTYDSVLMQTEQSINAIIKPTNTYGSIASGGVNITDKKLAQVKQSFQSSKSNLTDLKNKIKKEETRIFIQYNDKAATKDIARLMEALKSNGNYYVAPAEYIDNSFPTIIKMYNHTTSDNEKNLFIKVLNSAGINQDDIKIKRESNRKLGDVIEIWVNGRPR